MVWTQQLDLTTDETDLRAFVYAAPTVVDLVCYRSTWSRFVHLSNCLTLYCILFLLGW